jgi:exosortase/archaeosortase family protein
LSVRLSREQLLAGLCLVVFANGALLRAYDAVDMAGYAYGWTGAAMNTFGISVIVWAALWIGLGYILKAEQNPLRSADLLVGSAVLLLSIVPSAVPAWLGLTLLATYLVRTSEADTLQRRGAWILFALTIPMCWSRVMFAALSDSLLELEAILVGTAMGTTQVGNMVQFADGSGYMEIWPACSSFANVSLAILCWVTFCQVNGHRANWRTLGWCALACMAVVAINVFRISLIGFFPHHYDLLHGPIGYSTAGWLTLLVSVGVCALGVGPKHDISSPHRVAHA